MDNDIFGDNKKEDVIAAMLSGDPKAQLQSLSIDDDVSSSLLNRLDEMETKREATVGRIENHLDENPDFSLSVVNDKQFNFFKDESSTVFNAATAISQVEAKIQEKPVNIKEVLTEDYEIASKHAETPGAAAHVNDVLENLQAPSNVLRNTYEPAIGE